MPRIRLTDRGLQSLEVGTWWDELLPGFHVRVSKTGRKTFAVRYRASGKHRRQKVGVYDREAFTLADARAKAREMLRQVAGGDDPAEPGGAGDTFESLARDVLERRARRTRKATQDLRSIILENDLLPAWGDRHPESVTRSDVTSLHDAIAARGAPALANRALSLVHLIFNDGIRLGRVESNPAHLVEKKPESGRDRFLDRSEIGRVWTQLDDEHPTNAAALRVTLLTAQRVGSVRKMRWDQIQGSLWRIPAEVFKGKREMWVPLSTFTQELLEGAREGTDSPWCFPALRSDSSVAHVGTLDQVVRRVARRSGVEPFTAHDFRTTFRTHALRPAEKVDPDLPIGLGISPQVADAVLGHKPQSVGERHYAGRPEEHLLAEKRDALGAWGAWVRDTVGNDG